MCCNAGKLLLWLGVLSSFTTIAVTQLPTAIPELPMPTRTFLTGGIVHGEDVVASSQWPWQVFIELDNGYNQCGGTLISKQWILTAAHCFDGGKKATKIVMGTISRSNKFRRGTIGIADIVCCHQKYNTVTLDYDICLIKLAQARERTVNIDWLSLPTAGSELVDGTECYITGWGYNEKMVLPDILQEATVKVVGRQQCIAWHKPHNTIVVNNTVCAGHELGGADSCGGDSGGPMVCRNHLGDYILQGVTSYGPSYCGAAKLPGIYTKVSAHIDWIREKMNNPCLKPTEPKCPPLTDIPNGRVQVDKPERTRGTTAQYTCDEGYLRRGPRTRFCLPSIQWSRTAPTCVRICDRPQNIAQGKLIFSQGNFAEGSRVTYSCNQGYRLRGGHKVRTCTNGSWSGKQPRCQRRQ